MYALDVCVIARNLRRTMKLVRKLKDLSPAKTAPDMGDRVTEISKEREITKCSPLAWPARRITVRTPALAATRASTVGKSGAFESSLNRPCSSQSRQPNLQNCF